jgi:hypothetical protein
MIMSSIYLNRNVLYTGTSTEVKKNSSIVIWRHVNFNGMYDFTEEKTKKATDFDIPKILNWKLSEMVHDETYLDSMSI